MFGTCKAGQCIVPKSSNSPAIAYAPTATRCSDCLESKVTYLDDEQDDWVLSIKMDGVHALEHAALRRSLGDGGRRGGRRGWSYRRHGERILTKTAERQPRIRPQISVRAGAGLASSDAGSVG